MQPILETERLLLRPRTLADTDSCLAMDCQPQVLRYVSSPWRDPAEHRAFIDSRTRGPYPPGLGYWTIFDKQADLRLLGWVELIPENAVGPRIEIGWRLTPDIWGRGIATEAALRLLRHGFETLALREIIAYIDPENLRSIRVAEKIGLRRCGEAADATGVSIIYVTRKGD